MCHISGRCDQSDQSVFAYEAGPIILLVLCQITGRLPDNSLIFLFWRLTRLTNKPVLSFSLVPSAAILLKPFGERVHFAKVHSNAKRPISDEGHYMDMDLGV